MKLHDKSQIIADNLWHHLIRHGWVRVPPGWKLVPIVPTPAQILAGADLSRSVAERYTAMVDAAPEAFNGDPKG